MSQGRGRAPVVIATLVLALLLSAGNLFLHLATVQELTGSPLALGGPGALERILSALGQAYARNPEAVLFFALAPLVVGLILASWIGLGGRPPAEEAEETGPEDRKAAPSPAAGALRLLALLQQEGRFIDFVEEDIQDYDDAQVGAAVRAIHAGCRNALHERMKIERVYDQEDGTPIEVPAGFDPASVRLTGNVQGKPPFSGTLQHAGWRAREVSFPVTEGVDATILAPAEVEIA